MTGRRTKESSSLRNRRMVWWAGTALLGAVLSLGIWLWLQFQPLNPSIHRPTYFRVVPGQSAGQIGYSLYRKGLVRSPLAFRFLSDISSQSRALQSGVYRITPGDSPGRILAMMERGDVVTIRVSIPEGFTVQQIVQRLIEHHIGSKTVFRTLLARPLPGMPQARKGTRDPYEGYLFPATYQFPYGISAKAALATMWQTFKSRALVLYRHSHSPLSLQQWVTMASIIQQENKNPSDAPKISGVFVNRLRKQMPLQSDATVRYAIGHALKGSLTLANLRVNSPYNTYLHKGLPPGPICSPGTLALKAALRPAKVPYLYFLALPNGHTLFATTYAQQLANIRYAHQHF